MYPALILSSFVTLLNGQSVPCDHPLAISEGKGCSQIRAIQILTPLPTMPECSNPYPGAAGECKVYVNPNPPPVDQTSIGRPEWYVGASYRSAYPSLVITVTSIGYSNTRPGIRIITAEWNTNQPGFEMLPISFYEDRQPQPFFQVQ